MKDQLELKTHLRAETSCELRESEPAEGFGNDVYERLKRRKRCSPDQSMEARWTEIYRLLFPNDELDETPSPCIKTAEFSRSICADESNIVWEPPLDEPAPTTIAIEDFIRQEVPRRARRYFEEQVAAVGEMSSLMVSMLDQMEEIYEAQIQGCILEHQQLISKENELKTDFPTPPISSLTSPAVAREQPWTNEIPVSMSDQDSRSDVLDASRDWDTDNFGLPIDSEFDLETFLQSLDEQENFGSCQRLKTKDSG